MSSRSFAIALFCLLFASVGEPGAQDIAPETAAPEAVSGLNALSPGSFTLGDDSEIILSILLGRRDVLTEAVIAYVSEDDVLLPLQELAFLLEFPITVSADSRSAEGWFITEDRRFLLDLDAGRAIVNGQPAPYAADKVRALDGEIYVAATLLSAWFPIEIAVNLRSQVATITGREALPIDVRRERERRQDRLGATYLYESQYPRQPFPYRALSVPAVDFDLRAGLDDGEASAGYTLRATGDLLFLNGELFITGTEDDIQDARLRLGRIDPDRGLLGPLRASEFQIGDTLTPSLPLSVDVGSGRGVFVTSTPAGFVREFDRVTLEGDLPPNYEAELYRNGALIAVQSPGSDNRYRFEDVSLFVGENTLRIEIYGPQGQRDTEVERFFVGTGLVPKGDLRYSVGAVQDDVSLFGIDTGSSAFDTDGSLRAVAQVDYGYSRDVTLSAGIGAAPVEKGISADLTETTAGFAVVGARTQVGGFYLVGDAAIASEGGAAAGIGVQTRRGPFNVSLRQEGFFGGFESENADSIAVDQEDRLLISRTEARVDTFLDGLDPFSGFSLGVSGGFDMFEGGANRWDAGLAVSSAVAGVAFGNDIRARFGDSGIEDEIDGTFRVSGKIGPASLRAVVGYEVSPGMAIEEAQADVAIPFSERGVFRAGVSRSLEPVTDTDYFIGADYQFDMIDLGFRVGYGDDDNGDDGVTAFLTASFSLYGDPARSGRPSMSYRRLARRGAVSARVFLDEDGDGVRDPQEPPVEGIRVYGTARETAVTDASGSALLVGLPVRRQVDVAIDVDALPDPFLRPVTEGYGLVARPGTAPELSFGLVPVADLEGVVSLRSDDNERPAANVLVRAIRKDGPMAGEIVSEVRTEFDGFYLFASIPVGEYEIAVDPEQLKRLSLFQTQPVTLTVTADTEVAAGLNIVLARP